MSKIIWLLPLFLFKEIPLMTAEKLLRDIKCVLSSSAQVGGEPALRPRLVQILTPLTSIKARAFCSHKSPQKIFKPCRKKKKIRKNFGSKKPSCNTLKKRMAHIHLGETMTFPPPLLVGSEFGPVNIWKDFKEQDVG